MLWVHIAFTSHTRPKYIQLLCLQGVEGHYNSVYSNSSIDMTPYLGPSRPDSAVNAICRATILCIRQLLCPVGPADPKHLDEARVQQWDEMPNNNENLWPSSEMIMKHRRRLIHTYCVDMFIIQRSPSSHCTILYIYVVDALQKKYSTKHIFGYYYDNSSSFSLTEQPRRMRGPAWLLSLLAFLFFVAIHFPRLLCSKQTLKHFIRCDIRAHRESVNPHSENNGPQKNVYLSAMRCEHFQLQLWGELRIH